MGKEGLKRAIAVTRRARGGRRRGGGGGEGVGEEPIERRSDDVSGNADAHHSHHHPHRLGAPCPVAPSMFVLRIHLCYDLYLSHIHTERRL